jgi:quercetin dioxygenase-like cupin family protein
MIVTASSEGYKEMVAGVRLKSLVHGDKTHLTEVRFIKGAMVPEHQHPQEQTGYLISGSLRFFSGDRESIVSTGDSWVFAGGEMHGAEALEDTVIVEMFSPVRDDFLKL